MSVQPHWQQPSHPHLLEVVSPSPSSSPSNADSSTAWSEASFLSYSTSKNYLEKGEHLITLTSPTLTLAQRAYSSVQVSAVDSVELNCDFLYLNHSCNPSLELRVIDLRRQHQQNSSSPNATTKPINIGEAAATTTTTTTTTAGCPYAISIHATRDIRPGDELTFFYPSTEWDMAQTFACQCGAGEGKCLGTVKGAKFLDWSIEEVQARNSKNGWFVNDFIWDLSAADEKWRK